MPGAYLRVLLPGTVRAGDRVVVVGRPDHDVTVGLTFRALTREPGLLPPGAGARRPSRRGPGAGPAPPRRPVRGRRRVTTGPSDPVGATGAGDPRRTVALLWRHRRPIEESRRGPRRGTSVDDIVAAATLISDRDGLEGLTMRRVAGLSGSGR